MTNVGNIDRIIRAVAGLVLLVAPFLMAAWPGVWAAASCARDAKPASPSARAPSA